MVKYGLLTLGLLACLALTGFVAVPWLMQQPPGPGITQANFELIRNGMSRGEVEAILGGPPTVSGSTGDGPFLEWRGPAGVVSVRCVDGVVDGARWYPGNETFLARCRRWLGI